MIANRLRKRESDEAIGSSVLEILPRDSLRDEAALLLSIADIAKSELTACPLALAHDFLRFPDLSGKTNQKSVSPSTDMLNRVLYDIPKSRLRTVSIDSPMQGSRTPSPLACHPKLVKATPVTPIFHRSTRQSSKARNVQRGHEESVPLASSTVSKTPKKTLLQGKAPSGVVIKKIMRRKFSWKNYPQLEEFLVANREEYLRHSALNYTLQQKQYNNRLSERLLELATEHGYMFDETDFNFVTVRDRIRCYYKSFVQSAKKRGVLMGYAARKAGLLSEDDIEKSAGQQGRIVTPN